MCGNLSSVPFDVKVILKFERTIVRNKEQDQI